MADRRRRARRPAAAGTAAVLATLEQVREIGLARGLQVLARVNQVEGFDCPGCAWPESLPRKRLEFCENGSKAVTHEATAKRVTRDFFARWSVAELAAQADLWLEAQGRLTEPMRLAPGASHYPPISWDAALSFIREHIHHLASPHQGHFSTPRRNSDNDPVPWPRFSRKR